VVPRPSGGDGCRRPSSGVLARALAEASVHVRRVRHVRWKEVVCLWRVLGPEVPVKVVVAEVEGYKNAPLGEFGAGLDGLANAGGVRRPLSSKKMRFRI